MGLFKGLKKLAKPLGKLVGKAATDVTKLAKNTIKDIGSGAGGLIKGIGKTTGSGDLERLGKNVKNETKSGVDKYGDIAASIAGNALTGGAYGAITNLANMAATGKIDKGSIIGSIGSLAGLDPKLMNIANAAIKGDAKSAALGLLGNYGTNMGINQNLTNLITAGAQKDKGGLASAFGGAAGLDGDIGKILSGLASKNKGDLASGLGGYFNLDKDTQRILSGVATGDNKSLGLGLLGSLGGSEFMGANRFDALDRLAMGEGKTKDKLKDLKTLTGGLLPDIDLGFGGSGSSGGSKDDSPGFLSNFKGLLDFGTPDALKNLGIPEGLKGVLDFGTPDALKNFKLPSGLLPSLSLPSLNLPGVKLPNIPGVKLPSIPGVDLKNPFSGYDVDLKNPFSSDGATQEEEEEEIMSSTKPASESGFNIGDWLAENSAGLGTIGNLGAGVVGAFDMDKAYQRYQDLQQQQLDQLAREGTELGGMKYDPTRYKQERDFLQERIAGGGLTAKEKQMQQEGDLRAARAGAGARAAALEQMARTGSAASGSGAALAAALGGGQSVMDIQSASNLQREASAADRLEQDIRRTGALSTQQTMEEANLAQLKQLARMQQLQQMGGVRQLLGESQIKQAGSRSGVASGTSDMLAAYLGGLKTNAEKAEVDKIKADAEKKRIAEEEYNAKLRAEQLKKLQIENAKLAGVDQPVKDKPVTTAPVQTRPSIATPPIVSPSITPKPAPKPSAGSYTIKSGDSLSKIAGNLGYSNWKDLYAANKDLIGDDPNKIKAGASLRTFNEAYKR